MPKSSNRRFRPGSEALEGRQLLAKVLSGVDIDGDQWVLKLSGPGDFQVINQPGDDGFPVALGEPALIDTIQIGGTDPSTSLLQGTVSKGASGDGRVFFQNLIEFNGPARDITGFNGIHVIDMPDFWLGRTSTDATVQGTPAAEISIPDGINNLRFGGADTTYTPPGGTPLNQNGRDDLLLIALGIPRSQGTAIIINQSITNGQAAQGTNPITQDGVEFHVLGRLNLFQADEILGNSALPSGQYVGDGGTLVISSDGREQNAINAGDLTGSVTGQIGYIRVGGNATNFSVQTNDRVANYYVGGETNNIFILAPGGARHLLFGKGMDTANIRAESLNVLQANRGALNSEVIISRGIGQVLIGGDVVDTTVRSGYEQELLPSFSNQFELSTDLVPQSGGTIGPVLIAGDVVDSVFAASVLPFEGFFGAPEALVFPKSTIHAKVEGTIDNALIEPDTPEQAFFAGQVSLTHGPIVPPRVVEPPFPHQGAAPSGPRISKLLLPTNANSIRRQARLRPHH